MQQPSGTQSYQNDKGAGNYLKFIDSEDGAEFKKVLGDAISARLAGSPRLNILDGGCGPGWLAYNLSADGHNVIGCDASPQLINIAKSRYPKTKFDTADLTAALPYQDSQFDCAILSLSALDLADQEAAFKNLRRVLKTGGKLIMTTVNPYYGYPVGLWKRGLWRFIFRKYPKLRLKSYNKLTRSSDRKFVWNKNLISYFYTLPEQITAALKQGFNLSFMQDITAKEDDQTYSLRYRLFRFPIFILLEFTTSR